MKKPKETITTLGKELYDLKAEKEQAEDNVKRLNLRIQQLERQELPRMMEDAEQETVKITGCGTIYLKPEINVYVIKAHEEEFFKWLRANKHGNIIKETVHHGTLKSWTKEQLEEGGELPPQLETHQFMQAVLRRS